ncbi:MAG: DEAD/DEAH box helicase [Rhodospirillaceae bacterium]|nr:MAG: DEAD/DEAH box helicase [Rhodospirillaceae bacterium]
MSFEDLGLTPDTLKAVTESGYTTPTPIQEQAIPVVLMGRDVLGVAQTGTGKTAAFTMPMIDILADGRSKARMPRSLIIAPTRELAAQIADNFIKYGKYHPLNMALLIGGESMSDQEKALDRGVDVLIATPGRLLDLFERGRILLNDVKIMVIDEADRMLDMGFIPDVERIVSLLPKIRQTLFFSATMNKEIRKLADQFLMNPKEIAVAPQATAAATVVQGLVMVRNEDKREALRRILRAHNVHNAFIFCNRKRDVDILFKSLEKHGFSAVALHGDMPQSKRNDMLAKFKANEAELLVCSDVAARGLDISDVGHVINFDVPVHAEDYIHRIGRTGRAGKAGHAFTLSSPGDHKQLAAVEKLLNGPIPPLVVAELGALALSADIAAAETEKEGPRARRGRAPRRPPRKTAPVDDIAVVQQPTLDFSPPPEAVAPEPVVEEEKQAAKSRPPRERKDSRHDRNRDVRGPQDRARKTRRNPHGIAEMDIDDDVVAFGGFTPAFLLVDPYGGKGAPQEIANVPEDVDDEDDLSHETVSASPAETNLDLSPTGGDITELAARSS